MATKKKPSPPEPEAPQSVPLGELRSYSLDQLIVSPLNPRLTVEEEPLRALADSIRSEGLLENLVGRPTAEGEIEILAGGRRLRAMQLLKAEGHEVPPVPVLVRELDDGAAFAVALAENLARRDIHFIDECIAFHQALSQAKRGDAAAERLSKAVGKGVRMIQQCAAIGGLEPEFLGWGRADYLGFDRLRAWTTVPKGLREEFIPVGKESISKQKVGTYYGSHAYYLSTERCFELPSVVRAHEVLAPLDKKWGQKVGDKEFVWIKDRPAFIEAQKQAFEAASATAEEKGVVYFRDGDPKTINDPGKPQWVTTYSMTEDGSVVGKTVTNEAFAKKGNPTADSAPDSLRCTAKTIKTLQLQEAASEDKGRGLRLALLMMLGCPELGAEVTCTGYASVEATPPPAVSSRLAKALALVGLSKPGEGAKRGALRGKDRYYGLEQAKYADADRELWSKICGLKDTQVVELLSILAVSWVDLWATTTASSYDWPLVAAIAESWELRDPEVLTEDFLAKYPKPLLVQLAVESGAVDDAAALGGEGKTRKAIAHDIVERRRPDWLPALLEYRTAEGDSREASTVCEADEICAVCEKSFYAHEGDDYVGAEGDLEFRCYQCIEAIQEKGPDWRPNAAEDPAAA